LQKKHPVNIDIVKLNRVPQYIETLIPDFCCAKAAR